MGSRPLAASLLIASSLFLTAGRPESPTLAAATGRIDGVVVNGTNGHGPPQGVQVTTHVFRDRTKIHERTATTDSGGRFTVEALETTTDFAYFPIVEYGGASYYPERPLTFDEVAERSVQIKVFEPTTSDAGIAYDRVNMLILGVDGAAMTIMEMGAIVNSADRTLVGEPSGGATGTTLRFWLPSGAMQVSAQAGISPGSLISTPDGFATTDPVTPGRRELAFSYQLPLTGPALDLTRRQVYPAAQLNVYAPDNGIVVTSPRLTLQGNSDLGGQRYQMYSTQSLEAGSLVALRLTGLPARPRLGFLQIGLAVVGATTALFAAALLVFVRRREKATNAPGRVDVSTDARFSDLVAAIARLDARYDGGELASEPYLEERARRKSELVEQLTRSSR